METIKTLRFIKSCRNSIKKGIEGHFAEAGCWKGHSSYMISKLISENLEKYDQKKIEFHIFDSFEGLSEIKDEDTNVKKLEKNRIDHIRKQFISDEKFLKEKVLKNFDFVKTHKGWILKNLTRLKMKNFLLFILMLIYMSPQSKA